MDSPSTLNHQSKAESMFNKLKLLNASLKYQYILKLRLAIEIYANW